MTYKSPPETDLLIARASNYEQAYRRFRIYGGLYSAGLGMAMGNMVASIFIMLAAAEPRLTWWTGISVAVDLALVGLYFYTRRFNTRCRKCYLSAYISLTGMGQSLPNSAAYFCFQQQVEAAEAELTRLLDIKKKVAPH